MAARCPPGPEPITIRSYGCIRMLLCGLFVWRVLYRLKTDSADVLLRDECLRPRSCRGSSADPGYAQAWSGHGLIPLRFRQGDSCAILVRLKTKPYGCPRPPSLSDSLILIGCGASPAY